MFETVNRLTESMRQRVALMVGRAILSAIRDDAPIQTAQASLLADEVQDDAERIQQYGFSSVPLAGAEGVLVFVGGNRDHGLIIATDDRRYRKTGLQPGEVCLYTDEGDSVVFNRGRIVRLTAGAKVEVISQEVDIKATSKVVIDTPLLQVTGDIQDKSATGGRTMSWMRARFNDHDHIESNTAGGSTQKPSQQM